MLLSTLFLIYLSNIAKSSKRKKILFICSMIPFLLVSGLRYDVGTDYFNRYAYDYTRILNGIDVSNLEIGFKWLMQFTMLFSVKPFLMFFITSLLIIGCIFKTIEYESKDYCLSVLIFFLGGFFFESLNIMRQYVAIGFTLIGVIFLLRKKRCIFVFFVVLASLFHGSCLIMLVLLFLIEKKYFNPKLVLFICLIIVILNENLMFLPQLLLQNTRFDVYFSGKFFQGDISVLFIAENLTNYILMVYLINNGYIKKDDKKAILYLNIQTLALLAICMASCHMLFIRITSYFSIFQIISIPYFITESKKYIQFTFNKKRVLLNIPKLIVIICYVFAFYRTNIHSNTNEVLPYKSVIKKDISIF